MLTVLGEELEFPHVERALDHPNGLLAVGGDLSLPRLAAAYSNGIFPWYSEGQPILWWSPDPRTVLKTESFHPGRTLRKKLARIGRGQLGIEVRLNTACAQVLSACAEPRPGQQGTWILPDMQDAYYQWHLAGVVQSVETWLDNKLIGGLYGVALGRMFFGESMFTRAPDASKIALAYLVAFLRRHGVTLIDCQQETPHIMRMGACNIPRADFVAHVRQAVTQEAPPWGSGRLLLSGELVELIPA